MGQTSQKKYRFNVTVNKKLYDLISEKSRTEVRSGASVVKYFLIRGLEADGYENIDELAE